MKKYKLTSETITVNNRTLYRIEALRDFGKVKKGDKGGFVQSEKNLSHEGTCWVAKDAWVADDARVLCDAWITGAAYVFDDAKVGGAARVAGKAWIYGHALVFDNAIVRGTPAYMEMLGCMALPG